MVGCQTGPLKPNARQPNTYEPSHHRRRRPDASPAARSTSIPKASFRARRRGSRSPGVPRSQLDTFDGSIEVHSWDRDEVEVEIEKRAMEQALVDDMKVTAEQEGNRIVVKVTAPRSGDRTSRHSDRRPLQPQRPAAGRAAAQQPAHRLERRRFTRRRRRQRQDHPAHH